MDFEPLAAYDVASEGQLRIARRGIDTHFKPSILVVSGIV
jgi:hypothetical protein